jgi:hypothetical protein
MNELYIELQPFVCDTCHQRVPGGRHRAVVITTWRADTDVLCTTCWRIIMQAAEAGMRAERPELFADTD